MARSLLVLATCVAGALATMGMEMGMGATTITAPGSKITTTAGGNTIEIDVSVTIIEWSNGGGAAMNQVAPPSMAVGMTHYVTVGGDAGLIYSPSTIMATKGDMVQFNFMSQNHTVTQSGFTTPCIKMSGGMDSMFMPNPNNTMSPPPSFKIQIVVETPLWFYCRQKGHCGKGMVFSINPTADKTHAKFLDMAIAQNGTATASTVTSQAAAAASPPPPAATPPPPAAPPAAAPPPPAAAPPPSAAPPAAAPPASAPPPPPSGVVSGNVVNGACNCFCGVAAFPPMAGIGNFGGMGGAAPMEKMM